MEFIFFIALAVGIGMFAKHKGRSAWGWGIASIFISPLLAGIILALMKDLSQAQEINKVDMEQQRLNERVAVNEMQVNQRFEKVENQISSIKKEVGMLDGGQENAVMLDEGMKQCPHCGEMIKQSAVKCRYCGSELESVQMKECPFCKELIRADATKCKFCRSELPETNAVGRISAPMEAKEENISAAAVVENKPVVEQKNESNLLCPHCSAIIKPGAKFCGNCGVSLEFKE